MTDADQPAGERAAIRTTGLYDPAAGEYADSVLVVEDGRIVETREDAPGDVRVAFDHDGPAIPGIVDAHSHASIRPGEGDQIGQLGMDPATAAVRAVNNLAADLAAGTTTMRLMAAAGSIDVSLAEMERAGELTGPRLLPSGQHLTPSDGHGLVETPTDGPDEIRRQIRENFRRGATHTKFFSTGGVSSDTGPPGRALYSREEVRAIVAETDRHDSHTATHAHGGRGARVAIEEGVDTIEHASLFGDREVALLDGGEQFAVGTFSISRHPAGIERGDGDDPAIMRKLRESREQTSESWRRIVAADVPIALGTDSMHGFMPTEMRTLAEFGATREEAIHAATLGAARAARVADTVGDFSPGKRADLVCLDADPLESLDALDEPAAVFKDGDRVA